MYGILNRILIVSVPNKRFHIEGTGGTYIKYGFDPQEDQLKSGMLPFDTGYGVDEKDTFGTLYNETEAVKVATETGCYQQ